MTPSAPFLASRVAFQDFLAAWEACTLPGAEFTHAAHIAVGAAYTVRFGDEALTYLREHIMRFNVAAGSVNGPDSGYHETITRLWTLLLAKEIADERDEFLAAQRAVSAFAHRRDIAASHYSFDVVKSREARVAWIEPDLQPLS